jgi:adenine-specific DNA-methyltransferase
VIERIVKACSNSGDLLLDPFVGSGTTAVVALSLNRPVIGFEISEKYLQIAIQRIENLLKNREAAESQGALFVTADL